MISSVISITHLESCSMLNFMRRSYNVSNEETLELHTSDDQNMGPYEV